MVVPRRGLVGDKEQRGEGVSWRQVAFAVWGGACGCGAQCVLQQGVGVGGAACAGVCGASQLTPL